MAQVFVIKPKAFWQRQKTGMNFQLKKSRFNFPVSQVPITPFQLLQSHSRSTFSSPNLIPPTPVLIPFHSSLSQFHSTQTHAQTHTQVIMLENSTDIFHHLQVSQITKDLGGTLPYDHEEWIDTQRVRKLVSVELH